MNQTVRTLGLRPSGRLLVPHLTASSTRSRFTVPAFPPKSREPKGPPTPQISVLQVMPSSVKRDCIRPRSSAVEIDPPSGRRTNCPLHRLAVYGLARPRNLPKQSASIARRKLRPLAEFHGSP